MTNNLLIETLDELIKAWKSTNPRFTNLTKALTSKSRGYQFQNLHCTKVYVPKHVSLPKAFIEASNKSNIVIFIALLFVI
jgi:hypothetical protein